MLEESSLPLILSKSEWASFLRHFTFSSFSLLSDFFGFSAREGDFEANTKYFFASKSGGCFYVNVIVVATRYQWYQ